MPHQHRQSGRSSPLGKLPEGRPGSGRPADLLALLGALLLFAPAAPLQGQAVPDSRALHLGDQQFVHRSWSSRNGLPVNHVTGLLQGESGYLWLSTFDGLLRFDGMDFVAFNQSSSPELPTARLSGLLGEAHGAIWLESERNELLEFRNGRFQDHRPAIGPLRGFYIDPDGMVWAGSDLGLLRYTPGGFEPVVLPGVGTVVSMTATTEPGSPPDTWSGLLWITSADHVLHLVDPREGQVLEQHPLPWAPGGYPVQAMAVASDGALWLASAYRGSIRFQDGSVETHPVEDPTHWVTDLVPPDEDGQGGMMQLAGKAVILDDGVWRRLETWDNGKWPQLGTVGPDGSHWLASDGTLLRDGVVISTSFGDRSRLIFDHEGSAWIGSITGLHQVRPASLGAVPLYHDGKPYHAYGLHQGPTGTIWITAFRPREGTGLWRMQEGDPVAEFVDSPALPIGSLEMAILESRNGDLWVSSHGGGVCRLDADLLCPDDGWFPMGGRDVRAIFEDSEGVIWFGAENLLKGLSPDGTWFTVGREQGMPDSRIRAFLETPEGHLWLATQAHGIARWNGESLERLTEADGLAGDAVRALFMDGQGILWVGTEGRGLSRVEEDDSGEGDGNWKITTIRRADGLFDDGIHQILGDEDGRLWMSTNRGLFFVSRADLEAFSSGEASAIRSTGFDERDGLLNRELNGGVHGAGIQTATGRLIFPGMEGLAVVEPTEVLPNPGPPELIIESGIVNHEPVAVKDGVVRLPRASRNVELTFSSLSFWSPPSTSFRYRLAGVDEGWREMSGRRSLFYTNLPPGRHTFELLASQDLENWTPDPVTIDVVVPYRISEHPFSQAAAGLLVLLAIFGVARLRETNLQEQARRLEVEVAERTRMVEAQAERLVEMDRLKSRLFEDISHEFRTPLTLIITPLENARRHLAGTSDPRLEHDVDLAIRSAKRLLDLVGQILDLTRLEAGRLQIRVYPLDPASWLRRHILSFTPLADVKEVNVLEKIPASLPAIWSSRDLLHKMVGNLISNAIKYSPQGGLVRIRAWTEDDFLKIEVRDTGPGIPQDQLSTIFKRFSDGQLPNGGNPASPSTGIGLSLAQQLAELHGGGIHVESEEGFGAQFTLRLRLGHHHFPEDARDPEAPEDDKDTPPPEFRDAPDLQDGTAEGATAPGIVSSIQDPAHGPTVLVVEDHPGVRSYLTLILSEVYRVDAVENGAEALNRMASRPVDLILSDLRMPELNGLELLHRVREQDRTRQDGLSTPFVLLSARDNQKDRSEAYSLGASAFLTKPIPPQELLACIDGLLRNQESLRKRRPVLRVAAGEVSAESSDAVFLARLAEAAEVHLRDPEFGPSELASALGYSRSALYRKLAEIGEDTPAAILTRMRLDRAAQLLEDNAGSVSRIALQCGFRSASYFSRVFKEAKGVPPSRFPSSASRGTESNDSATGENA